MSEWLLVLAGGALGAPTRYLIGVASRARLPSSFHWGTFLANMAAALLLGFLVAAGTEGALGTTGEALLSTGFCGALSTWSTFSKEVLALTDARRVAGPAATCWPPSPSVSACRSRAGHSPRRSGDPPPGRSVPAAGPPTASDAPARRRARRPGPARLRARLRQRHRGGGRGVRRLRRDGLLPRRLRDPRPPSAAGPADRAAGRRVRARLLRRFPGGGAHLGDGGGALPGDRGGHPLRRHPASERPRRLLRPPRRRPGRLPAPRRPHRGRAPLGPGRPRSRLRLAVRLRRRTLAPEPAGTAGGRRRAGGGRGLRPRGGRGRARPAREHARRCPSPGLRLAPPGVDGTGRHPGGVAAAPAGRPATGAARPADPARRRSRHGGTASRRGWRRRPRPVAAAALGGSRAGPRRVSPRRVGPARSAPGRGRPVRARRAMARAAAAARKSRHRAAAAVRALVAVPGCRAAGGSRGRGRHHHRGLRAGPPPGLGGGRGGSGAPGRPGAAARAAGGDPAGRDGGGCGDHRRRLPLVRTRRRGDCRAGHGRTRSVACRTAQLALRPDAVQHPGRPADRGRRVPRRSGTRHPRRVPPAGSRSRPRSRRGHRPAGAGHSTAAGDGGGPRRGHGDRFGVAGAPADREGGSPLRGNRVAGRRRPVDHVRRGPGRGDPLHRDGRPAVAGAAGRAPPARPDPAGPARAARTGRGPPGRRPCGRPGPSRPRRPARFTGPASGTVRRPSVPEPAADPELGARLADLRRALAQPAPPA